MIMKKKAAIYIHGKGGLSAEAEHYSSIFTDSCVFGFDYHAETPWEAASEFSEYYDTVSQGFDGVYLIANSIGAYFSLCSLADKQIEKAFFISPVVDMEKLISDMMTWAGVSEAELREKAEIPTTFGETLSWEYLNWVREHPVSWKIPTEILYGEKDHLQTFETISRFAEKNNADVTVMPNGEHWFHTDEQMRFLDEWLKNKSGKVMNMNTAYEHKSELTLIGFHTEISPDEGYRKCPEFWDKEFSEKYARLWQTMKPETPVEAAILENGIGMYAICAGGENSSAYWIAGLYKGGEVPDGLELFTCPESEWAIFTAKGPIPETMQSLNTQVWDEWAPKIKNTHEILPISLEVYSAGNPRSPEYECGIWVPIRKKADLKICQSCGMPMESEDVFGTDADGSLNEDYCKYCYVNGEFADKVSMAEYIDMCSRFGAQAGMTNEEMKAYCEKLFPTLKRWKRNA